VAPLYDLRTQGTANWLNLKLPRGVTPYVSLGQLFSRQEMQNSLSVTSGLKRVKVFFGHGTNDALLGPPQGTNADILVNGKKFSIVYDSSMITTNPAALFAFCCNAGVELGKDFSQPADRSFLGFTSDIFVVFDEDDKECSDVWKTIIREVSTQIIKDGKITLKHEELLSRLYDQYLSYFQHGKGSHNEENAFYMILSLNEQRTSMCRY
jgi:hypothetical protein